MSRKLQSIATPLTTLTRREGKRPPWPELERLVREYEVGEIVIGLPLDMRGTEGEAARRARLVAQDIADATGCDVELWDERLTTVEAARALRDSGLDGREARKRIDEASAVTILQAWLDRGKR